MSEGLNDFLANVRSEYKLKRRRNIEGKHQEGHYVTGEPIEQGHTKAHIKARTKEEFKNRHKDTNYKALTGRYMNKESSHEKALNKGLLGKLKGLMGAKHFGESKKGREVRKLHEKTKGSDLF